MYSRKLDHNKFEICYISLPEKTKPDLYHVRKPRDITKFENKFEKEYVKSPLHKSRLEANVYIGPVAALGGKGVYAGKAFSEGFLSFYVGEDEEYIEESESHYLFQVAENEVINSEYTCNWTAYMNHASLGNDNCFACTHQYDDQTYQVYFTAAKNIAKDDQLFFDYGETFFDDSSNKNNGSFKPIYLHPSDNWRHPHDVYLENLSFYDEYILLLEDSIATILGITKQHLLVTSLFKAVYENDLDKVKQLLKDGHKIELPSYTLTSKISNRCQIQHIDHQDNLTPFMLACALGNEEMIRELMKAGADINRCGLHTGHNSLFYILMGKAEDSVKIQLMTKLINRGAVLVCKDSNNFNLLAHAICNNQFKIIDFLLSRPERNKLIEQLSKTHRKKLCRYMKEKLNAQAEQLTVSDIPRNDRKNKTPIRWVRENTTPTIWVFGGITTVINPDCYYKSKPAQSQNEQPPAKKRKTSDISPGEQLAITESIIKEKL